MRILVTGAGGMLGHALAPVLEAKHQVTKLSRKDCDLCNEEAVDRIFRVEKPELVMHLAAFTNVDACERNPAEAKACNADATLNVSKAAHRAGAAMLYTSTDYVFDGLMARPYGEDDVPKPRNVYGYSKLMGEMHVRKALEQYFIVRTSWLFGPNGKNFVSTILRVAEENPEIQVVNDQRGSPTYTRHLAEKLVKLVMTQQYGVYHASGSGECTWFEFARTIVELAGFPAAKVKPVSSLEYVRPAPRPAYSVLSNARLNSLGIGPLPCWQQGLESYLSEIHMGRKCVDNNLSKPSLCSEPA